MRFMHLLCAASFGHRHCAQFLPGYAVVDADRGNDAAPLLRQAAGELLAQIQKRAVFHQNRAVRGVDGRAVRLAPGFASVEADAAPCARMIEDGVVGQRAQTGAHAVFHKFVGPLFEVFAVSARIEREPRGHDDLIFESDNAGVAVVQRGIMNNHRFAPRFAVVVTEENGGRAPRADVLIAEAGRAGNQGAVVHTGNGRPAEIAVGFMRHAADFAVTHLNLIAHGFASF